MTLHRKKSCFALALTLSILVGCVIPDREEDPNSDELAQAATTLALENGVPATGLSGAYGSEQHFSLAVPTGASNLSFRSFGGSGDADLYVRFGAPPTRTLWDYRPYKSGNAETVTPTSATAGTWYVMLRAYRAYAGVTLVGSYTAPSSPPPPPPPAGTACSKFASTTGNDSSSGSELNPFRTADKLVRSLSAGQTGCLVEGTYAENLIIASGGQSGAPITLTSAPGGRATLRGRLWIKDSANHVTISGLLLDGRNANNLPSPTINGDYATFSGNEVTNYHTTICFSVGNELGLDGDGQASPWGLALNTIIDRNRIHDCGKLPRNNHEHGIYVCGSRNARITNNFIYDNADRGIQIYPDNVGVVVRNNIVDGNATGILIGSFRHPNDPIVMTSKDSDIRDNIISNQYERYGLETYWENVPLGTNNVVTQNCLWNNPMGNLQSLSDGGGYVASNNLSADPFFVNRAAKDFRIASNSACAGKGPLAAPP